MPGPPSAPSLQASFLPEDDQGSATQAPTAAQAVLGDSSAMAVIGPAFSGASKAADPLYNQAGLAMVTPSATDPTLQTHGWNNFFRVVADDDSQGPADAQYIVKKLAAKSVYAIDDASAYAQGLVRRFDTEATTLGAKVTHETAPGTTQCQAGTGNVQQYGAAATKVKASGDSTVFYAGYYCDFALLAKALRGAGFTGQMVSDDGSESDTFITQAGAAGGRRRPGQLRLPGHHAEPGGDVVQLRLQEAGRASPPASTPVRPTTPPTPSSR